MSVLAVVLGTVLALFLLYCAACVVHMLIQRFWHFVERKDCERDYLKLLRDGKDVEILDHEHEKILGIPIVEYAHRKSMRRNVREYSDEENFTFVNPVLKLVDGEVVIVGGIVRRKNKPIRRISVEKYLHFYDPPKPQVYRFERKQGKYVLVSKKTKDQKQAE